MASIKEMNQTIAKWLYGNGVIMKYGKKNSSKDVWRVKNTTVGEGWKYFNFHEDYDLLMEAFEKFMSTDGNWYALYSSRRGKWTGKNENKLVYTNTYSCPITTQGFGRMGYGSKFNTDFEKESIILAMHYSLYRFIKNGREY